ncbi:uncharacterized protein VICG_00146 [Vittaforma corneae ATCC 50505]|uniref:Mechanosensitive ion channel MscS domain-containing protein n=1 Tax=Vittaforma corneae (strain ATCC 50505) TaxID=993615 RepID=L2GPR4_VITCO|nr:uncharacterized protein VICG_00146 [Vittaforma corneae ATCC 50505]ELA42831.1 hypothetical protein VICG_00146 [Vittaforma corneae ATCC 50505]
MEKSEEYFDWFDYHGTDDGKIDEDSERESLFKEVFDFISLVFFIIFCISFCLNIVLTQFLHKSLNVSTELTSYHLITPSWYLQARLDLRLFVFFMILLTFEYLQSTLFYGAFEAIYRYLTIFVWMLFYWFHLGSEFVYSRAICLSFVITSIVYGLLSLMMMFFEENLISSTLKSKIKRTNKTEEILKTFKRFAYDISQQPEHERHTSAASDVFSIDFNTIVSYCIVYDEGSSMQHSQIKPPEIWNVKDAIRLSRDVFLKAASEENEMSIENLRSVFDDSNIFERAKSYIDISRKKSVSNKKFRDVVVSFYYNRLSLAKSIKSQILFVDIIRSLLYTIVFAFLSIIYLIIFGVDIKELFAVVVSSAIALHFLGSAAMKDILRGIMLVLSHRFDIGDDVVIAGEEMTVYNIGIISSSFILENGGIIKLFNSELCNKPIVNVTNAPENLLIFTFDLPSVISEIKLNKFKKEISEYLKQQQIDFYDNFVLSSPGSSYTDIKTLKTTLILKCRINHSRSRKFVLRADITSFLNTQIDEIFKIDAADIKA